MTENHATDNDLGLLTFLRRYFKFDERWRFILLFLVINLLIFILIWLFWQNEILVRELSILETRVVVAEVRVVECEVDCTDKMSTVAVRQGEKIAQMTATIGALVTRPPVPEMPTDTPAWTATPLPTFTPVSTPVPPTPSTSPTWTPTPPTPTATPTPTSKPKPPDTPIPPPTPPVVLGIAPTATVRSVGGSSFPVTITGQYFARDVKARLGADIWITDATSWAGTTITGTLSPSMPVGIYGLTVTNLDGSGQSGRPSPVFTVYRRPITILESPFVVAFGRDAQTSDGTPRPQAQQIFFEVPDSLSGTLYVHIFDADTGGLLMVDDYGVDEVYNTTMTYTLSGSTVITSVTIGQNDSLDNTWGYAPNGSAPLFFLGPFFPSDGVLVGDRRRFELVVEGGAGDDANWYRVALSTQLDTNAVSQDAWIFASLWTGLVHETYQPDLHLHPYVMTGTMTVTLGSQGCEYDGLLQIRTPFRNLTATCSTVAGTFTPDRFGVEKGEDGMTWTLDLSSYTAVNRAQYLVFRAEDEKGSKLPIFVRPTTTTSP